jgi:hypothetical protein
MDAASLNVRTISDPDGNEIAVREVRALDQEWVYMFMEGSQRSPQLVSLSAVTTPNTTPVMLRGEGVDGWVGCNSMYRVYVVSCGSWSLRLLCFCFGD